MRSQKILAANWKMNFTPVDVSRYADEFGRIASTNDYRVIETIVFPQTALLSQTVKEFRSLGVRVGAQNCSQHSDGAFTGETSAELLRVLGVKYCLVGHSERRSLFGETDEICARKTKTLSQSDICPIVCVGETMEERKQGKFEAVLRQQLTTIFSNLSSDERASVYLAYEPVWAIGTGESATPEQIEKAHGNIRDFLVAIDPELAENMPIIYGGSVNRQNAVKLLECDDLDGFLVGGASLRVAELTSILRLFL